MKKTFILILILSFVTIGLSAQDLFKSSLSDSSNLKPKLELNGYVRGVGFGVGPQYDFTSIFGEIALKPKLTYGNSFLYADVRLRSGSFYNAENISFDLKEAYAGYKSNFIDVYLGNQIIAWGRTDGFNPTNHITPNDYFFLSDEPDDQKLSNFMLRSKIRFTPQTELELIAIPVYKPSQYRYELFNLGEDVNFQSIQLPEKVLKNSSLAVRFNYESSKAGIALSVFHGYDPFYGFDLVSSSVYPAVSINYAPKPFKKTSLGADFAIPAGNWIFRAEAAYNITKDYDSAASIPNPSVNWVFGTEHDFWGTTAILQYIGVYSLDFDELNIPKLSDPANPQAQLEYATNMILYNTELYNRKIFNQQEETNHALFLSLSRSLAHDLVNIKLSGFYNFTSEEYMIRPDIKWKLTDDLTLGLGANLMNGPEDFIFYKAGRVLNGGYTSLTVNF